MSPSTHEEATPAAIPTSSGEVAVGAGRYLGYTVRETGGASPVRIVLFDNASAASGPIIEEISLVANGADDKNFPPPGRYVANGIYAQITGGGTPEGSVFV